MQHLDKLKQLHLMVVVVHDDEVAFDVASYVRLDYLVLSSHYDSHHACMVDDALYYEMAVDHNVVDS